MTSLAILWHQHQPYYPDDVTGQNLFPWVRLHGTKDYYGMAMHLKEVPEFRCTINLVPSLVRQIRQYTEEGRSDQLLDLARIPADSLTESDAVAILESFFMANAETMIRPFPKYRELADLRRAESESAATALPRFTANDLRDLQVWHNLAWIHPIAFEIDAELRSFREKGRRYSESEKTWLIDRSLELLAEVLPLHRKLAESGQVELTTTPFFHPILPLLWDKRSAHEAMPGCDLPDHLDPYPEDARRHLQAGVDYHREVFGSAPVGMWPSEGSVSEAILPAIAETGIRWIATDEGVLARSMNGIVDRDERGHLRQPEMLYRPWTVGPPGSELGIVFRDHELSDLIGFHYQRANPRDAAEDLLGRIARIGEMVRHRDGSRTPLVPIILDGENCWEYYPDGGVEFLRTLYREAARHPNIRPQRMRDAIDECPPTDRIPHLAAGSWINHNFAIWIGHSENNNGWDRLHETRTFLLEQTERGHHDPEIIRRAWEELDIAEGSDWFWWYGDDHSSDQDALFDQHFRDHLKNVYRLLGKTPPESLSEPISQSSRPPLHTDPTALLHPHLNGVAGYFDWRGAGRYVAGSERGTMTRVSEAVVETIHFGFGPDALFLRIDPMAGVSVAEFESIDILFANPIGLRYHIDGLPKKTPTMTRFHDGSPEPTAAIAAAKRIVEIAIPHAELPGEPHDLVRFVVDVKTSNGPTDRFPSEGRITITVPGPEFEAANWIV